MNDLLPREKALTYGVSSLNNKELIALIIKSGYKDYDVFKLAESIIDKANGFDNILSLTYEELISIKGIKTAKAMELLAILEISKRLSKIDKVSQEEIKSPTKIVEWLRFNVGFSMQEEFVVIYMNYRGNIIKSEILFKGSKNSSTVAIDEILRKAILLKSSSIIVAHNHPSDNINPSPDDIEITDRLKRACELIGIRLLDHIIIGKSNYFSFKSNSLLC